MKYCDEYAALLDAYLDGECSEQEAAQIQAHLAICPGCRAYVDGMQFLREDFPTAEGTEVPEGFAESVMAAIRVDAVPQKHRLSPWKRAVLPMAACLAIVVAVGQLVPFGTSSGNSSPAAAGGATADAAQPYAADAAPASSEPETATQDTDSENAAAPSLKTGAAQASEAGESQTRQDTGETSPSTAQYSVNADVYWTEYDNVIFAATVALPAAVVGDALDGYEGLPYTSVQDPSLTGTGYAMTAEDCQAVLAAVPDAPAFPEKNPQCTTELCCIVVTD